MDTDELYKLILEEIGDFPVAISLYSTIDGIEIRTAFAGVNDVVVEIGTPVMVSSFMARVDDYLIAVARLFVSRLKEEYFRYFIEHRRIMLSRSKVLSLDLDGVIADAGYLDPEVASFDKYSLAYRNAKRIRSGFLDSIVDIKKKFGPEVVIVIHTARPIQHYFDTKFWLQNNWPHYDYICHNKLLADAYFDDRAIRVTPDYNVTAKTIEKRLGLNDSLKFRSPKGINDSNPR